MPDNSHKQSPTCLSCGAPLHGRYCSHCGEKVIDKQEYQLIQFLRHVFHAFTNFDANFVKSFVLIVRKPGFLTKEYVIGRRKPYLKPVQMFLIANFIYFFLQPYTGVNGFNTPLNTQMNRLTYSTLVKKIVNNRLSQDDRSIEEYSKKFNEKSEIYAKSLIFVMIPIFAFLMYLLNFQAKRYFVEHLIFSIHFFVFYLFYFFTIFLFLFRGLVFLVYQLSDKMALYLFNDTVFAIILLPALFYYFYNAFSRLYTNTKMVKIIKSVVLAFGLIMVVDLYRLILFFVTFFTT